METTPPSSFVKRHGFFVGALVLVGAMVVFGLVKATGVFEGGAGSGSAVAGGPGGTGSSAKGGPPRGGPPASVSVTIAAALNFNDRIEVIGTAFANESVIITPNVQDVAEQVLFDSGQRVSRGQSLVVLASGEERADLGSVDREIDAAFADADAAASEVAAARRDLQAAQAGVAEAKALEAEAQLAFGRTETLAERGFAAQARVDADRTRLEAAKARVQVAEQQVAAVRQRITGQQNRVNALNDRARAVAQRAQSARARVGDRTIRAPFNGVIGLRDVSPGQFVRPGDTLATLDDVSQIRVDFSVPEDRLSNIRPGVEVVMRADGAPGQMFTALVRHVDSRIDPATRSVRARAFVPNPTGTLKPGMLMSVDLRAAERSSVAIPEVALREDGLQTFAFLSEETDGGTVARQVAVTTGARRNGMVEILSGVSVGDQVVTEGLLRLRDGQSLQVVQTQTVSVSVSDPAQADATGDAPAREARAPTDPGGG